jgi:hypothetical protein
VDHLQEPRPLAAREVEETIVARVSPDDVPRARAVQVCEPDAIVEVWMRRRICDDVPVRPAVAAVVEPDVNVIEANLHEVCRAVSVDVSEMETLGANAKQRTILHHDLTVVAEASARALPRALAPHAGASTGPVRNVTTAQVHDVLKTVAVHVGELKLRV